MDDDIRAFDEAVDEKAKALYQQIAEWGNGQVEAGVNPVAVDTLCINVSVRLAAAVIAQIKSRMYKRPVNGVAYEIAEKLSETVAVLLSEGGRKACIIRYGKGEAK